jgi:hypothetical protein
LGKTEFPELQSLIPVAQTIDAVIKDGGDLRQIFHRYELIQCSWVSILFVIIVKFLSWEVIKVKWVLYDSHERLRLIGCHSVGKVYTARRVY